jgi:glycosyltransferase involved in cell wall biosynthesis
LTEEGLQLAQQRHRQVIDEVLGWAGIDLIHFHGLDFHKYLPEVDVPMLATLHLPVDLYPDSIFHLPHVHLPHVHLPHLELNCVSQSQASTLPGSVRLPVVSNGIDVSRHLEMRLPKQNFLLVIARICPEKGIHIALRVAHSLDLPLVIAGPVHPFESHQKYFHDCVKPLLDTKRQYFGPADLPTKAALLAQAACVLIPSLIAETSSLVAMEAISSGTPVIAFRSGALPEIVEHRRTGLIVDTEEEMADAVRRAKDFAPDDLRLTAKARFDTARMVADYLNLYKSMLSAPRPAISR